MPFTSLPVIILFYCTLFYFLSTTRHKSIRSTVTTKPTLNRVGRPKLIPWGHPEKRSEELVPAMFQQYSYEG